MPGGRRINEYFSSYDGWGNRSDERVSGKEEMKGRTASWHTNEGWKTRSERRRVS